MIAYIFKDGKVTEIEQYDIVVATDTDCDLTERRLYTVIEINAPDMITVKNDLGEQDVYTTEWFKKYNPDKDRLLQW